MLIISEDHFRTLNPPLFFDENLLGAVDHDVGDLLVLQKKFERTESERLVENLAHEALALVAVEERILGVAEILDNPSDFIPKGVGVHLVDPVHIEPVNETHVNVALERLILLVGGIGLPGDRYPWRRRLRAG